MKHFRFFALLLIFCTFSSLYSAMPIFHVYIAEKWMEAFEDYDEEEKRAFILGTLFPDIRYLQGVSREETHDCNVTLENLMQTTDPFLKGKKLHSFVDETRSNLLFASGFIDNLNVPDQHKMTFIKILEDEILCSEKDWNYISEFLLKTDEKELPIKIPKEAIRKWHFILSKYFSSKPSVLLSQLSKANQGYLHIPADLVKIWSEILQILSQEEKVKEYVSIILEQFHIILQNGKK
jgi:hypothetical protein